MRYFLFLLWMFVYFHLVVSEDVSICAIETLPDFSREILDPAAIEQLQDVPVWIDMENQPLLLPLSKKPHNGTLSTQPAQLPLRYDYTQYVMISEDPCILMNRSGSVEL